MSQELLFKPARCKYCEKIIPAESKFCLHCGKEDPVKVSRPIEVLLDAIQKGTPTAGQLEGIRQELANDWDAIIEQQIITRYFIQVIREARVPTKPQYIVNRQGGDSRTGHIFEDAFGQLFGLYLQAEPGLWTDSKEFLLDIALNPSIAIPGEEHKRKPDVIVYQKDGRIPLLVAELKASFGKHSLKKDFEDDAHTYHRLNPRLEYTFIIFRASELKTKTYKTRVPQCRVICTNFKVDPKSLSEMVMPDIIDPVERIFQELKDTIVRNLNTPSEVKGH